MRVLVTGSEGQVGSWVLDAVPAGVDVQGLDLRAVDAVDVRSERARALAGKADAILHLAALIDVAASMKDPAETMSVNVEGTRNLLRGARPGSRFVFVSSAAVYGDAGEGPIAEDAPTHPLSPYGDSKLQAEGAVHDLAASRGLGAVVVRPFNIYSSRQDPSSPYTGVISAFISAALAGRPLRIDGDGGQTRDFVHASDVASFLWLCLRHPQAIGRTFNVATGTSVPILGLAALVQHACRADTGFRMAPPRAGDIRHSAADVRRAKALGWQARLSLADGLAETLAGLQGGSGRRAARPAGRQD